MLTVLASSGLTKSSKNPKWAEIRWLLSTFIFLRKSSMKLKIGTHVVWIRMKMGAKFKNDRKITQNLVTFSKKVLSPETGKDAKSHRNTFLWGVLGTSKNFSDFSQTVLLFWAHKSAISNVFRYFLIFIAIGLAKVILCRFFTGPEKLSALNFTFYLISFSGNSADETCRFEVLASGFWITL